MSSSRHKVPTGLYWQTRLVDRTTAWWVRAGNVESGLLGDELSELAINKPIYVTGLARAGTTITTELLNHHPQVTSHRYSDFPFVFTPYWRNWLLQRTRVAVAKPVERVHGDRILVTNDSPEAVEEALWMYFFPNLHRGDAQDLMDRRTDNPAFEEFYSDHIKKLLLVRSRQRYLAKGNYNISRIRYLLKLFPDARFVVLVRKPLNHIASLAKQDRFFREAQIENPRIRTQLGSAGHFEFGLDLQWIGVGDENALSQIREAWEAGRQIKAWALYWSMLYGHLSEMMAQDPDTKNQILMVPYEQLCARTGEWIDRIMAHCDLPTDSFDETRTHFIKYLTQPDYYRPEFDSSEQQEIERATTAVAAEYGY